MMAKALLLPPIHASAISSDINSPTAIYSGGGLRTADGASTPTGIGSPRIESGPFVIHVNPWTTACEVKECGQAWAAKMKRLLCDIKDEIASTSARHTTLPPDRLAYYEAENDALIAQGFATNPAVQKTKPRPIGRPKQSPPKNLLDHLHKPKAGVLAFMYDFRIPFDNNLVERDVRMIKVQQKVSGSFRTEDGAHIFCALRSYISAARKHGLNAIDANYNAFLDQPFIPDANQAE